MKSQGAVRLIMWIRKIFPDRQVYIRSGGHVQFFTFGSMTQAILAGCLLIFLGWTAFATVIVVFKDRAIADKDHQYQQMRSVYEDRLSELHDSYDALNEVWARSEQGFNAAVERVRSKQEAMAEMFAQEKRFGPTFDKSSVTSFRIGIGSDNEEETGQTYLVGLPTSLSQNAGDNNRQPKAGFSGIDASAISLTQRIEDISLRLIPAVAKLFSRHPPVPGLRETYVQHPALVALSQQTERVRQMDFSEASVIAQAGHTYDHNIQVLLSVVRNTGINPDQFIAKISSGEGGPEIPIDQVQIVGISDPAFTHAYLRTAAVLDRFHLLFGATLHIPLALPVNAAQFDRTSGFGPRLDPFTGRFAFHSGIDFGGPTGAPVVATAAGLVVFAGNQGSYGNMVEIDHGMGLHTRYAHLSILAVHAGTKVKKGTLIGNVGSTGRSTGPHVHYEIWYDNVVRNPAAFLAAGGYAFRVNGSIHSHGGNGCSRICPD